MRAPRRLAILLTAAVLSGGLPLLGAGPAAAADFAVTAPADSGGNDALWYTGETRATTWTVNAQTGPFTLELWTTGSSAAKRATIGSGPDITVGTYSWTIPPTMTSIVGEDLEVRVVPQQGSPAVSAAFDLRQSELWNVELCKVDDGNWGVCSTNVPRYELEAGGTHVVSWRRRGQTGAFVKIELERTVGGVTTRTLLAASEPNDERATVTIPTNLGVDGDDAQTYRVRVSTIDVGPLPDLSDWLAMPAVGLGFFVEFEHDPFELGQSIRLELPWQRGDLTRSVKVEAKPQSGKAAVIHTGEIPQFEFEWHPSAVGIYDIVVTDATNKKLALTIDANLEVIANADVLRQAAPSDATAVSGQPITISWGFFDDANATEENEDVFLPVDINVVSATGKVTKLAKGYVSDKWTETLFEDEVFLHEDRRLVWRPAAALAPGTYTIKVNRTGSTTTSDQTITIAAPTTLTTDDISSASFEPGAVVPVTWNVADGAELPVNISLVPAGDAKPIALAKKLVAAENATEVTIPATVPAGSYQLTVATVDKFGDPKAVLSASEAVTITAPTITVTAGATIKNGQDLAITWDYGDDSRLPVKLELFKGSATKPVTTIAKTAPTNAAGDGSFTWTVPPTVLAGTDYSVKATVLGPKAAAVADSSSAIAVTAPTVTVDDDSMGTSVNGGQTVPIEWTSESGVDQSVTVSVVKGTKVVAKIDAKEITDNGGGSLSWVVPSKLKTGSDYKIRVTDNKAKTITDDSVTFTIVANQTTAAA